jgi:hypothetical protein
MIQILSEIDWENAASISTAISLPMGIFGLFFLYLQIRQQKYSSSFQGNFSVLREITSQYERIFQASNDDDEALLRREIVNILALFEYIAGALNKGTLDRRLCELVQDHVIDIIRRMIKSEYYVNIIKSSRSDEKTYIEIRRLLRRNRSSFSDPENLREAFGYEKSHPWMWQ